MKTQNQKIKSKLKKSSPTIRRRRRSQCRRQSPRGTTGDTRENKLEKEWFQFSRNRESDSRTLLYALLQRNIEKRKMKRGVVSNSFLSSSIQHQCPFSKTPLRGSKTKRSSRLWNQIRKPSTTITNTTTSTSSVPNIPKRQLPQKKITAQDCSSSPIILPQITL